MGKSNIKLSSSFVFDIKNIIGESRSQAVRSVEFIRVQMYWRLGERIFNEEQQGKERADYGTYLLQNLAKEIEPEYGSGFAYRQLARSRQFYRTYPIVSALRTQLNWSQYKMLIAIENEDKREFYELESLKNLWTGRELERQINSSLYERLLLSTDKEAVMAIARNERLPQTAQEIIKDPTNLEFLGLKPEASYYEKDFEQAIISHLQEFLLEIGDGFSFVARQKRIHLDGDDFFVDLVFYNRLLQCFVIIEIKTRKLTHQDLGQLQMYVNYYDRVVRLPHESATIGILLCADKNDSVVKFTLPLDEKNILTSKYHLYLPTEKQLLDEIKRELKTAINDSNHENNNES